MKTATILMLLFTLTFCGESKITNHQPTNREIVNLGLKELDLRGVSVRILPLPEKLKGHHRFEGGVLDAFITGAGDQYILRITKLTPRMKVKVIAHELIHLMQYRSGRIRAEADGTVYWEGKRYKNIQFIPYNRRPWEREAQIEGRKLEYKLREKLK